MTRIGGIKPPQRPRERAMPRWLAFALTAVAFTAPIATLFLLASPLLLQRSNLILEDIELVGLVAAAGAIGVVLAICLHYGRVTH